MSDVLQIAPKYLKNDRNGYALIKAIEAADNYLAGRTDEAINTLNNVETMPEWRLDERAWEMNLTWYDYTAGVEVKRNQIRGARDYFDRLGTPYAVEQAIADVWGEGRVEEWFEDGSEPYHFSVYTSNTGALIENRRKFMALLDRVKNVRSVLDSIIYYGQGGQAQAYTAAAFVSAEIQASATAYQQ